jgi:hypothetical protein
MDVASLLASLGVLAKEMGKGGGGSTEEPTVCFALLPVAVGVLWMGLRQLRQAILKAPGGRTAARTSASERKVQTA